jgi:AcrR family transcriptional regulator
MDMGTTPRLACPSPFLPILPDLSGLDHPIPQPSVHRLLARRAHILAATRRSIADDGFERFTVRSVSQACAVTVQTIYNSFGNRQQLLVRALNEHTVLMDDTAAALSPGAGVFMELAELYYRCALETPAFLREIVTAAFATQERLAAMQRYSIQSKISLLQNLPKDDFLSSLVDIGVLATQITRVNSFAVYDWSQHGNANELRKQIVQGNRLLLLGVLRLPEDRLIACE